MRGAGEVRSASTTIPVWSSPERELLERADHPVGDMPVGLARSDGEPARQHGAGQRDDDHVADVEVVRATDDPATRLAVRVVRPRRRRCTTGSSCRWTAARRRSEDATDDQRPLDVDLVDGLDLEAGTDERVGDLAGRSSWRGMSTYSRTQDNGTRIRPPCRTSG